MDGTEPASAFTWQVDFMANGVAQPFYVYEVPAPFYTVAGVTSGSFQIPTDVSQTSRIVLPDHHDRHRLARPDQHA